MVSCLQIRVGWGGVGGGGGERNKGEAEVLNWVQIFGCVP